MLVKFRDGTDRGKCLLINSDAVSHVTEATDGRVNSIVFLRDVSGPSNRRDFFKVVGTLDQVEEAFRTGVSPV